MEMRKISQRKGLNLLSFFFSLFPLPPVRLVAFNRTVYRILFVRSEKAIFFSSSSSSSTQLRIPSTCVCVSIRTIIPSTARAVSTTVLSNTWKVSSTLNISPTTKHVKYNNTQSINPSEISNHHLGALYSLNRTPLGSLGLNKKIYILQSRLNRFEWPAIAIPSSFSRRNNSIYLKGI